MLSVRISNIIISRKQHDFMFHNTILWKSVLTTKSINDVLIDRDQRPMINFSLLHKYEGCSTLKCSVFSKSVHCPKDISQHLSASRAACVPTGWVPIHTTWMFYDHVLWVHRFYDRARWVLNAHIPFRQYYLANLIQNTQN